MLTVHISMLFYLCYTKYIPYGTHRPLHIAFSHKVQNQTEIQCVMLPWKSVIILHMLDKGISYSLKVFFTF